MEYASDRDLAATVVSVLATLWFVWTARHGGLWIRPVALGGAWLGAAACLVGVVSTVRAWPDGTVVTGGLIAIYAAVLVIHGALTLLCGALMSGTYLGAVAANDGDRGGITTGRARYHLAPALVAVSTAIQVAIIADTLSVPDLYAGAAAVLLAPLPAWLVAGVYRMVTRPRTYRSVGSSARVLTGLLTAAALAGTAVWLLLL